MRIDGTPRKVVNIEPGAGAPPPFATVPKRAALNAPQFVQDDAVAALRHLLQVEEDIRACGSIEELGFLLVNETRKMLGARFACFLALNSGRPRVITVSGSGALDRNAPAVQWLEKELGLRPPERGWERSSPLTFRTGRDAKEEEGRTFPFSQGHWFPLRHMATRPVFGVLVIGELAFVEGPAAIGERIAGAAAHAAVVLAHRSRRARMRPRYRLLFYALCLMGAGAMIYPVPMTALAPAEVVPLDPFVVAAPIDGVIDKIAAAPNSMVSAGDVVVQYVDTVPRNELQVAEKEVSVAVAKLRQLQQSAFVDDSAKRELAQSRAEVKLKIAERDFARDRFDKSEIRASRGGIAIYADRKEWVGKPVVTGQRILEIADESKVQLRANLPIADVLDLKPGARVRAFLNGDPLHPIDAKVVSSSHQAQMVEGQGLVYRIDAEFDTGQPLPRPGVRGTAQLFSDKAPLGYYLFRRPLTWIRQRIGL